MKRVLSYFVVIMALFLMTTDVLAFGLPRLTTDPSSPVLYYIRNTRRVSAAVSDASKASYWTASNGLSTSANDAAQVYFVGSVKAGVATVKIVNNADGLQLKLDMTWAAEGDNWYLQEKVTGDGGKDAGGYLTYRGVTISTAVDASSSSVVDMNGTNAGCWYVSGSGTKVQCHRPTADGSMFTLQPLNVYPELTTDADHPVYYRIYTMYSDRYLVATSTKHELTSDATQASRYYFMADNSGAANDGNIHVSIYSPDVPGKIVHSATDWKTLGVDSERHWYLKAQTNSCYTGFIMAHDANSDPWKVKSGSTKVEYAQGDGKDYKGNIFAVEYVPSSVHELGDVVLSAPAGNIVPKAVQDGTLTLSYPSAVSGDDEVVSLKTDHGILLNGSAASVSINNNVLTISGLPTTVGSTFTITIPEGAVGYQTSGVTNQSMTLNYTIVEPLLADDFTGYVYTEINGEKKFLSRGSNHSTRLIYDDYGLALQIPATDGNGCTTFKCVDSQKYIYSYDDGIIYTDGAEANEKATFQFVKVGEGQYKIKANNSTATGFIGPKRKTTSDPYKLYEDYAENEEGVLVWKFMTASDYDALVAQRKADLRSAVLTQAGLTEEQFAQLNEEVVKRAADTETSAVQENFINDAATSADRPFTKEWSYSGLDNGLYLVSIKAFNRNGTNANVFAGYQYDHPLTFLVVNGQRQQLCSLLDGKSTTSIHSNRYHDYGTIDGLDHYTPNGMEGAGAWFDAGNYDNQMLVNVTDGTLNIKILRESYVMDTWTCYRDLVVNKLIAGEPEQPSDFINGDLSDGLSGWDCVATIGGQTSTVDTWVTYAPNNSVTKTPHLAQTYSGWSEHTMDNYSIKQTLALEAGTYRMRGYAFVGSSGVTSAEMFAGDNSTEVCHRSAFSNKADCIPFDVPGNLPEASVAFSAGNYLNELTFTLNEAQTIDLGFRGTHNAKQGWFCMGPVTLEKITEEMLAEEQAAQLQAMKDLYASRKTAYTAIAAQHSKSGLSFNTTTADQLCADASTVDEVKAAIQKLGTALTDYMDFFQTSETFDMTSLIVNPGFETADPIGWYHVIDGGDIKTHSIGASGETYYVEGFSGSRLFNSWKTSNTENYAHFLLQRLDYMPKGDYTLSAKFASDQSAEDSHLRLTANEFLSDYLGSNDATKAINSTIDFTLQEAGRLRIGAKSSRWFKADDFALAYIPKGNVLPEDWMAVDLGTINLENKDVEAYLNEADYSGDNPETILTGAKNSDGPRPVVVPIPSSATGDVKIYVTTTEGDYTDAKAIDVEANSISYDLVNLIPSTSYYYKVENDGTVVSQGSFQTTGRVRVLEVEGVHNVRDLGGHVNSKGQTIQYGMIFRGGELNGGYNATDKGKRTLRDLGVLAELDLRSWDNDNQGALHEASALNTIGGQNVEPAVVYFASNQWNSDSESMRDKNRTKWAADLDFVMDNVLADRPVYFHCRIGADRTGIMGLLIGGLLGLDQDALYKDYEITSFSGANATEELYRPISSIVNKLAVIKDCAGETLQEQFEDYCINTLGLDAYKIARFQAKMLSLEAPVLAGAWNEPNTVAHFAGTSDPGFVYEEIGAHTHGAYAYNDWSREQDSDLSGLGKPFYQDYTGKNDVLGNAMLTKTLTGMPEGYYDISARVRVYDQNAYDATAGVSGLSMIANDASVAITTGKQITEGELANKGFYGDYHIVGHVTADGLLKVGFKLDGADFNWLAFNNMKITYIGENDSYTSTTDGVTTLCGNAVYDAAVTTETRTLDVTRLAQHNAMQIATTNSPNVLIKANVGQVGNDHNVIVDGTCDNLELIDKQPFATDVAFTAKEARYSRTMPSGSVWGTICLPYYPPVPSGDVTFYGIVSCDGQTLKLQQAMPEAGVPYIFCCEATDAEVNANNVEISRDVNLSADATDDAEYKLVGTYNNLTLKSDAMSDGVSEIYYIKSNKFWAINKGDGVNPGTVSIPAFRAYIACLGSNPVRELNIMLDGEEATGLQREQIVKALSEDVVYNLAGQRLMKAQRGVNIINGKKVLK